MSFQGPYRKVKHEIVEEWDQVPQGYQLPQVQEEDIDIMHAASIEALVKQSNQQLQSLHVVAP